jgi:pimeloyl-ACP methyl ester carboxylesterase
MTLRNLPGVKPGLRALNSGDPTGAARFVADSIFGAGSFDKRSESAKKRLVDNMNELHIFDYPEIGITSYRLTSGDIRKITVPTLIMRGEHTQAIYKKMNEELLKMIPNSEEVIIPGVGHGSPVENPQTFNPLVLAFLRKHSGNNA